MNEKGNNLFLITFVNNVRDFRGEGRGAPRGTSWRANLAWRADRPQLSNTISNKIENVKVLLTASTGRLETKPIKGQMTC